jgi:hypothetical protein
MAKGMNGEVIRNVLRFLESGQPNTPVNSCKLQAAGILPWKVVNDNGDA